MVGQKRGIMERTIYGIKECANWLKYCLDIGYKKEQLTALEKLWWDYHDGNGNLTA